MRDSIKNAIDEYNKYHSPEAVAKVIKLNKNNLLVEFSGPFCRTCGINDYFDDLKEVLKEKKVESDITEVRELKEKFIVEFVLK